MEQDVQVLSLESVIETKLVQNNVTEKVLSALKEKYGDMKLKALDDKESYLELKSAAKDCAKVRTLAVKICKEGREEAVRTQKLWIAKEKEVVGKVAEVEDALDGEISKYDAEVERKATEEINRQEEAYINRQATLTRMGATFVDGSFVLGEASFEAALIKQSSQDVWEEAVVPKFQAEYEKIEAVRVAAEKEKAEREAEMKRQQEELERQQLEFKRQQEEFEKQKQEAERLAKEKELADQREREKAISDLQRKRFELLFPFNPTGADVDMNTLWSLEESRFSEVLEGKKNEFEKAQLERERLAEEKRLADIELAKQEAVRKEQERIAAEELKRQAELEAASDRKKWDDFINQVKEINVFEMRSGQYRKKMAIAKEKIDEILGL